ncbi:MAG TPA: hypothetical protein VHZ07_11690 [Bryobacteraceae bacterium]|jgi:hypothetical protein|nr:hypothetical protein [Bryobacteraceae bacterium]
MKYAVILLLFAAVPALTQEVTFDVDYSVDVIVNESLLPVTIISDSANLTILATEFTGPGILPNTDWNVDSVSGTWTTNGVSYPVTNLAGRVPPLGTIVPGDGSYQVSAIFGASNYQISIYMVYPEWSSPLKGVRTES